MNKINDLTSSYAAYTRATEVTLDSLGYLLYVSSDLLWNNVLLNINENYKLIDGKFT